MNEFEPKIKIVKENIVKDDFKFMKNPENHLTEVDTPSDRVSLSQNINRKSSPKELKNGTGEIRHNLVNKFKNILSEGNYSIKADEIADKLVQNIRDNKNHLIF
tara:strand:- start:684 stop:995 length:312 start_codon:yes stop_codon:yes gene_type:complete